MSTLLAEACEWAASLRLSDIPEDVRLLAEAQMLSMLGAVHASRAHPVGEQLRRENPGEAAADVAARAAALSMALDFDETSFAGHLGHSSLLVPVAYAATTGASGASLLLAQVAAAEIAARVTAAVTLGPARGQTASHTHLAAAAVGAGLVQGLDAGALTDALGLALSRPQRVLLPAFMGSSSVKCTVAAVPVRDAARAVEAARAGTPGPRDIMEVHGGLLDALADVAVPAAMSGYGERWHLRTLSFKRFPGCAYLSAAVDAAFELAPLDLESVEEIEVGASVFTIGMEAESAPFVRGPESPLPALTFSVGYSLATALETGALLVEDLYGDRLQSDRRWRVAQRVRLVHDRDLTVRALGATAPVGAAIAWAGEDARPFLAKRGTDDQLVVDVMAAAAVNNDDPTFTHPAKRVGARLRVKLRDGTELRAERDAAVGSCQESVADRLDLARRKYLEQATPRIGEAAARESRDVIAALATQDAESMSRLWAAQAF